MVLAQVQSCLLLSIGRCYIAFLIVKRFWVSPSEGEEAMWEKILFQFCRVDFGPQVAALVPNSVQLTFVSKMISEA